MTEDTPAATPAPWESPTLSLKGRVAIVAGAGQTPGPVIGNGRATAMLFARAGAHVVALDRDRASAGETTAMIEEDGGSAEAMHSALYPVNVPTSIATCGAMAPTRIRKRIPCSSEIIIPATSRAFSSVSLRSSVSMLFSAARLRIM